MVYEPMFRTYVSFALYERLSSNQSEEILLLLDYWIYYDQYRIRLHIYQLHFCCCDQIC